MEALSHKKRDGAASKTESFTDSSAESRETSSSGSTSSSLDSAMEAKAKGGSSSPPPLGWPIRKATVSKCDESDEKEKEKQQQQISHIDDTKFSRIGSKMSG